MSLAAALATRSVESVDVWDGLGWTHLWSAHPDAKAVSWASHLTVGEDGAVIEDRHRELLDTVGRWSSPERRGPLTPEPLP